MTRSKRNYFPFLKSFEVLARIFSSSPASSSSLSSLVRPDGTRPWIIPTPSKQQSGRYLETAGSWSAVVPETGAEDAAYGLDVDDFVLLREFFVTPSRVRLEFKLRLVKGKSGRIVGTRR
jgi:hypothetical protein